MRTPKPDSVLAYERERDLEESSSHSRAKVSSSINEHRRQVSNDEAQPAGSIIKGQSRSAGSDLSQGYLVETFDNINVREKSQTRIAFRKYPFTMWAVGIFIMLCGVYLIYHLGSAKYGRLFKGYRDGHWWQYVVAAMIILLGFVFFYAGKVESVIFDKEKRFLELHKTSVLCISSRKVHDLTQVNNIRCIKKGHEGINFYTLHYVIQAEFRQQPPIKILESQNRTKITQQLLLIRNFLGMFTASSQVQIHDVSTRI